MTQANLIKKQLDKIGNTVYLKEDEWISTPYKAVITHLWRKKSSNFEPQLTELGVVSNEYYLYIGPANHNIKVLSNDAVLIFDDCQYEFKCKDSVRLGDQTVYYTGILRKITGGQENDT